MAEIFVPVSMQAGQNTAQTLEDLAQIGAKRVYLALAQRMAFADGAVRKAMLAQIEQKYALYESAGYEVGVWIPSIGFGGPTAPYNREAAKDFTRIRSIFGKELDDAICPTDESFSDALCDFLQGLVRHGVKMIMLDDELCLSVRPGIGCACERHMAALSARLGAPISREELPMRVFSGGPSRERSAWIATMGDSMLAFCRKLRQAVDAVDPTVRMGFCAGYTSWDVEGVDAITLTRALAGNTRPFLRFTGAPYWCASLRFGRQTLGTVIETARLQAAWCRDADVEVFSEIDTYPRDRFHTPAALGECFDLATRATDGMSALKYFYEYTCQPDYERGYVEAHVRHEALRREIDEVFGKKQSVGVRVYETMRKLEKADLGAFPEGEYAVRHEAERSIMRRMMFSAAQKLLSSNAVPTVYEGEGLCGICFGENARELPLSAADHGLILDAKAALILQARGVDVGLASCEPMANPGKERFFDGSPETQIFDTSRVCRVTIREGARVLSRFVPLDEFYEEIDAPAAYLYENASGQRFLVYAFVGEEQGESSSLFWSYARGKQVADAVAWLGGRSLIARCERQPHLYAVAKEGEGRRAVAYLNLSIDEIADARIRFDAPVKNVRFVGCTGRIEDEHTLTIDYVKPYGFFAVEGSDE